jgi:hypothetical protein
MSTTAQHRRQLEQATNERRTVAGTPKARPIGGLIRHTASFRIACSIDPDKTRAAGGQKEADHEAPAAACALLVCFASGGVLAGQRTALTRSYLFSVRRSPAAVHSACQAARPVRHGGVPPLPRARPAAAPPEAGMQDVRGTRRPFSPHHTLGFPGRHAGVTADSPTPLPRYKRQQRAGKLLANMIAGCGGAKIRINTWQAVASNASRQTGRRPPRSTSSGFAAQRIAES